MEGTEHVFVRQTAAAIRVPTLFMPDGNVWTCHSADINHMTGDPGD